MKKKTLLTLFALCAFTFTMNAKDVNENEVPVSVKSYVTKNYPNAVDKEWEYKYKKNFYKVEFEVDGREVKLRIDNSGQLIYSKEELLLKDAPTFVTDYVQKNYSQGTILGVKKRVNAGRVTYGVGISYDNSYGTTRHRNIYFDAQGNVIRR